MAIIVMRAKDRSLTFAQSEPKLLHPKRLGRKSTDRLQSFSQARKTERKTEPLLPSLRPAPRVVLKTSSKHADRLECSVFSKTGGSLTRPKAHNQDAGKFCKLGLSHLLLVCDGHGDCGHFISARVVEVFPRLLRDALDRCEAKKYDGTMTALREVCLAANEDLRARDIGCTSSGSTCVAVLIQRNRLLCANVGDSRAVLGRVTATGVTSLALSQDHKPDHPLERARIEEAGGHVGPCAEQPSGSARVWFPEEDGPGLAMSRALGDFEAQEVGVTASPDITLTPRSDQDFCVVVASDGVWQYVDELEAVQLVEQASLQGQRAHAAERLVDFAAQRWLLHESRRDDITAVVAYLDP